MTPEEKFKKEVRFVLRQIKEKQLYTPKEKPIEYFVDYSRSSRLPISPDKEELIIGKLEEWGTIKIQRRERDESLNDISFCESFYLEILQPKFDELYRLYESGGSYTENQITVPESKKLQPIIKTKSLELIAKEIGEIDTGANLIDFLTGCGVDNNLIEYPQTKWRMVYSVLLTLASSRNKEDKRTLFKIIEGACHPLMYNGDKNLAKKTADKFNSFLEYDNFFIKNGVLWEGWEDPSGMMMWGDKDGNRIEPDVYLILPKKIDEIYVYWNELIKLTKFYFNNKDSQDDEINDIYFEIIANVEKLLEGNGCGGLKEQYKKPFRNIIGCEFEIQKQGLNADSLFVNLYDFLGKITELSLPDKNNVEKIKKDNATFFSKIQNYMAQHLSKKELTQELSEQESSTAKIEITKMPDIKIKGLEKLPKREKKQIQENVLYLNRVGDFYREPKEKHCYPMSESEGRHKIVRYFVENKIYDYYPTRELAIALEKDETSLMKEIGKINTIIQTKLKIKGKILDGKRGSGYRINPNYKIILKNG